MGATPRWMGYVDVKDVDATADRLRRLGGAVYVPPTDSNIGRIAVVADPQAANLAMVTGLKSRLRQQPAELGKPGRVGWHELLAADREKAFAFYGELFGWQKADAEFGTGRHVPVVLRRRADDRRHVQQAIHGPDPVLALSTSMSSDIDAAAERVKTAGGRVFEGPLEMPDGNWIARCRDPQGAAFALQGEAKPGCSSAGPPSGAGFRRRADWCSPARSGRGSTCGATAEEPDQAALSGRLAAATAGLGGGLSCRFDQEM